MSDEQQGPTSHAATSRRALWLAFGSLALLIGIPAGLFVLVGRPDIALWLVAIFVVMVGVTAYALREAVRTQRGDEPGS